MIEYALLIMLGFCASGLIALLLAPTLWRRAVRLTTKRLEATLPMTLSDIEADKDLLKASYAIKLRRLEAGLSKGQKKSASQLVEISKLQMKIGEFQDQIAELQMQLEERRNAANVFESTIRKRFPELENAVAAAKMALDERAFEINDLTNKMRRRDEALGLAQRAASLQQQEIRALRETLEKSGSDTTGRFKRRASQWTLDEYRSEYDRLNVELSKMREQLLLGHEREANQIAVLKTELQVLGEQIMSSVAAQDRHAAPVREPEIDAQPWPSTRPSAPPAPRRGLPGRPGARTQPWPGDKPQEEAGPPPRDIGSYPEIDKSPPPLPETIAPPAPQAAPAVRQTPSRDMTEPAVRRRAPASPHTPIVPQKSESVASPVEQEIATPVKQETREALQSLLDRGSRIPSKDPGAKASGAAEARPQQQAAAPSPRNGTIPDERPVAEALASQGASQPLPDPKLDQMFREIFESRAVTAAVASAPAPTPPSAPMPAEADANAGTLEPQPDPAGNGGAASEADPKRTLLDRLRVMHERQTG